MAKGGRVGYKRKTRNKVRLDNRSSDDSDEDYNVDEDEFDQSEDEYCSSLAEDESDESLGDFEEEEEEWVEKKVTKPRGRKNLQARKYNGVVKPRRKKISYKEEDEEEEDDYVTDDEDDDDFADVNHGMNNEVVKPRRKMISYKEEDEEDCNDNNFAEVNHRKRIKVSHKEEEDHDMEILHRQKEDELVDEQPRLKSDVYVDTNDVNPRKKKKVSYREGKEDGNSDDVDDEDDEEFTPSELLKGTRRRKLVKKSVTRRNNSSGEEFRDGNSDGSDDENDENLRKKNEVSYREGKEDDNNDDLDDEDDEEFTSSAVLRETRRRKPDKKQVTRRNNRSGKAFQDGSNDDLDEEDDENPRKKNEVSYQEGRGDGNSDDLDDEYDEEFTPSEVLKGTRRRKPVKKKVPRRYYRSGEEFRDGNSDDLDEEDNENPVSYREEKGDGNSDDLDDEDDEEFTPSDVLKGTKRRKPGKKQVPRRYNRSGLPKDFRDENPTSRKKKTMKGRRRKVVVNSDSDFVSSESDFEYSVSEDEREQVIEAEFHRRLATSLRSSSSSKMIEDEDLSPPQRKCPARKGKEKVVTMKIELVKQVCGICLSEEGKRTVKGVLNCCSHHFCFACIMEWSKVESRCPLCKQRFTTISRTTRVNGGNDLSGEVFPVPERDQVYQPSEEELRGFLDPYENVLCTECQQGGDDAFMLLCDLCDSPAHTYCVGLGREVPDGNWYCDGCRPTLASSNGQTMNPTPNRGASNNLFVGSSPVSAVRETFDLNEVYVPDTPLAENSQSPRNSVGDFQAASPGSGSGALTLLERRRIQRQIHQILNIRSQQSERSDGVGSLSGISSFGSPIGQRGVISPQPDVMPSRMAPQNVYFNGRLQENNTHSVFSPRSSLREQALHNQASTSTIHSFGGLLNGEFGGVNARVGEGFGPQQLHPYSGRSNTETDASTSPYQFREATVSSRTLQGSIQPF